MILVGNKCDLPASEKVVSTDLAKAVQKKLGIPAFMEASAKEGININRYERRGKLNLIDRIYYEVVRQIRSQKEKAPKVNAEELKQMKKKNCIIL